MSIVNFHDHIRARVHALADRQLELQETLPNVPASRVRDHLAEMDRNAVELSRLAGRLEDQISEET